MKNGARLYLAHTQLRPWANNMRVRYPLDDVRRMGISQAERTRQGHDPCVHDLVITPGPGKNGAGPRPKAWYIVAGHLRHAGNAWLGAKAPRLNCRVQFYADESAMLSDMSAENGVRSEPSPLGWARHYQRALRTKKLSVVLRESGKSANHLRTHLALLELSADAQQVIDRGGLPLGAVTYLAKVEDRAQQAGLAKRLAARQATLEQVAHAVNGTLVGNSHRGKKNKPRRPSTDRLPQKVSADLSNLRAGAAAACSNCPIGQTLTVREPAWHLALFAAGETCDCCSVRDLKGSCEACPLAEMMSRVARRAVPEAARA